MTFYRRATTRDNARQDDHSFIVCVRVIMYFLVWSEIFILFKTPIVSSGNSILPVELSQLILNVFQFEVKKFCVLCLLY